MRSGPSHSKWLRLPYRYPRHFHHYSLPIALTPSPRNQPSPRKPISPTPPHSIPHPNYHFSQKPSIQMKLPSPNHQQGASHLLLVLIVSTILLLLSFSIQIIIFLQVKQASTTTSSYQAYFAAEGAMFTTVNRINSNPHWPDPNQLPLTDTLSTNQALITRSISLNSDNQYLISITADVGGTKRKLHGIFKPQSSSTPPLDIILVLDQSGSMNNFSDPSKPRPIYALKTATANFIDSIASQNPTAQIGVVTYNSTPTLLQPLSPPSQFEITKTLIASITPNSLTNIGGAIQLAQDHLKTSHRPHSHPVILVFSDGIANRSSNFVCNSSCPTNPCLSPNTGYLPSDSGTCCTNDAITQAFLAKSSPLSPTIFSILLSNFNSTDTCTTNDILTLGRYTLFRISSEPDSAPLPQPNQPHTYYFETTNPQDLNQIYSHIATLITTPGFFQYSELPPD